MIQWDWGKRWWDISSAKVRAIWHAFWNWLRKLFPRWAVLLLFVVAWLGALHWLNPNFGGPLRDALFENSIAKEIDGRVYSALVYAVTFVLGLPVAFLVWAWRDQNKRDEIENARKDINLKEFQEVAARASGALDEKLPAEAREALQIAAIHQLRGFLRGDYGEGFRRPAFELLMAGHEAALERIGLPEVQKQIETLPKTKDLRSQISAAIEALRARLNAVDRARLLVFGEEAKTIFSGEFPLTGRRFDLLDLGNKLEKGVALRGLDLRRSSWFGADLINAHLEGADLWGAHLQGAVLCFANLEAANLGYAHLEGADLTSAHLERANLFLAHLETAKLDDAELRRTDLTAANLDRATLNDASIQHAFFWGVRIEKASIKQAIFDDNTQLVFNWHELSAEERKRNQDELRELGARHVDDRKPGAGQDGDE